MTLIWPGLDGPVIDYISQAPKEDWRRKFPRKLVILGSTGSIGRNTLSVLEERPDQFIVSGLAAGRNIDLLASQAIRYRPEALAVMDDSLAPPLRELLPADYQPLIFTGAKGYAILASWAEADLVVSAQSGAAGLPATLAAALAGKVIALANKESLVLAGGLLRSICRRSGAAILPLDSEHFALFQCLSGRGQEIARLVLTASGGPFRKLSPCELRRVTVEDALKHPNWNMGRKITIDSATMMNKGLELIEACHLFGVPAERVEVLIHPQSIIHSMVVLADNSMLAQLAVPDMRGPIASCLFWPRSPGPILPPPDLASLDNLSFEHVDSLRFPALDIAREALTGFSLPDVELKAPCVALNAANEMAVEFFMGGLCHFDEIPTLVHGAIATLGHLTGELGAWTYSEDMDIADSAVEIWQNLRKLDERGRDFVRSCVYGRSLRPEEED